MICCRAARLLCDIGGELNDDDDDDDCRGIPGKLSVGFRCIDEDGGGGKLNG